MRIAPATPAPARAHQACVYLTNQRLPHASPHPACCPTPHQPVCARASSISRAISQASPRRPQARAPSVRVAHQACVHLTNQRLPHCPTTLTNPVCACARDTPLVRSGATRARTSTHARTGPRARAYHAVSQLPQALQMLWQTALVRSSGADYIYYIILYYIILYIYTALITAPVRSSGARSH